MKAEYETINYRKIKHLNVLLVDIRYRTYHEHSDYEVLALLRGSARIKMSKDEFIVPAGSFAVFNSRAAHEIDAEGGQAVALVIQWSPYFCREYYPHARRLVIQTPNASESISSILNSEIMSHLCKLALHYYDDNRLFELHCVEDLMHLLVLFAEHFPCDYLNPEQHRSRISREHKIDTITAYLDAQYQFPVHLDEVAKLVSMTPAYLSHFVANNLGISFHDYLSNLRFEHALRQIDRDLSLSEIASSSGFSDLKYMTKMFLKNTGMTPLEYRRHHQQLKTHNRQKSIQEPKQYFYSEEQSRDIIRSFLNSVEL